MRTIKIGAKAWPYSLDGRTIHHAQPGDVLSLPNELADAALAYPGGSLELAVDPTTNETKAIPRPPVPEPPIPPTRNDLGEDGGEAPLHTDADPTTPKAGDDDADGVVGDDSDHEPGNDGATVPPKLTRAQKRAAKKAGK